MAASPMLHGQVVRLEGKQFMLEEQPFHPMVVNFSVAYAHTSADGQPIAPASMFVTMDGSWDVSGYYECGDENACSLQLLNAFNKARSMGFNTIRVVGASAPSYRHRPAIGANVRRFTIDVHKVSDPGVRTTVDLGPNLDDPYTERHFEILLNILDRAEAADMKVILLAGHGSRPDPGVQGSTEMYPSYDQQAIDDYASYLSRLANEMSDHPALLAYDLCNEPAYHHWDRQGYDGIEPHDEPYWTKSDVCWITAQWYDAIRAYDTDHLITIGGADLNDLRTWDPGVMKIDFYSLHTYPDPGYVSSPAGPLDQGPLLDRHHGRLHAFGQMCKIPWIIGETGFSANDLLHPQHPWPKMHGDEAQQAAFIALSLEKARSCGASGWSWWTFQDFR